MKIIYNPNTSHRHPAISPRHEARRAQWLTQAAVLCHRAERLDLTAEAMRGARGGQTLAAECTEWAHELRRQAAQLLASAAQITDWRDDLDRRDNSWHARLSHLVSLCEEAAPPRGSLDSFTRN